MIDVILCCYNQEQTISQALESIYQQDIEEDINLIIADDKSTDKTLEIIKNLKCPSNKFNLHILESKANLGLVKNYQRAFSACKGDFVLVLEGDDWWCSTTHIKQHVDFLKNHTDISMTMNCLKIYDVAKEDYIIPWDSNWGQYKRWTLKDQIQGNKLGNFSGCCFRVNYIKSLPESIYEIYFADWLLGIMMAEHGDIAVLQEVTSVYRMWPDGQWSGLSSKKRTEEYIKLARLYDNFLGNKYHSDFKLLEKNLKAQILYSKKIFRIFSKIRELI
jgi:glycosyltransferase involved in cell wall biosynthesis